MNTNVNKDPESKELKFILELLNSNKFNGCNLFNNFSNKLNIDFEAIIRL